MSLCEMLVAMIVLTCPVDDAKTGRYNKYSRMLPQTPWVLNGKRIMESSVEELICQPLSSAFAFESKPSLVVGWKVWTTTMSGWCLNNF